MYELAILTAIIIYGLPSVFALWFGFWLIRAMRRYKAEQSQYDIDWEQGDQWPHK